MVLTPAATASVGLPSGFHDSVAISGLEEPTNVRFAPDGRVFVAEKTGDILVYESLADDTPEVFADLQEKVYDNGDRGLLGLELDPEFPAKPYVYALYTFNHVIGEQAPGEYPRWENPGDNPTGDPNPCSVEDPEVDDCPVSGRLVRLTASGNHAVAEKVLVEDWCQQFSSHSIGQLHFGPEGALFATGGDGASFTSADFGQFGWPQPNQCGDPPGNILEVENGTSQALTPPTAEGGALRSQDLRTPGDPTGLAGSLIRIDPATGEGWPGNPLASSTDANARRILAYGFRNPFRFAIDAQTRQVYVDNVGWTTDEEIDRFPIDRATPYNSGWPCYEADEPIAAYQGLELSICENLYAEPGATSQPFFYYDHSSGVTPSDPCTPFNGSAISGTTTYHGSQFPSKYDGALFFADSVRGCIYVMPADDDGMPDPALAEPFLTEGGFYPGIDIEEGPGGSLYYASLYGEELSELGSIHKISYDPDAPDARLTASRQSGPLNLEVTFDAGESTGPSGQLEYEWDLDDDGVFESTGGSTRTVTFETAENATVAVRVTDSVSGRSATAETTVYPGDTPPEVEIFEPAEGLTWGVGQQIQFSGAVIAEEGDGEVLAPARLFWKTRLYHCPFGPETCHTHPLQVFPATESGSFVAPDHDYPTEIELTLTAADSRGLSATRAVKIKPRPVELTFASEPPGIDLTAGQVSKAGPFSLTAIENSHITVSAPQSVQIGGVTYTFHDWSDGGDRVHTVDADRAAEYKATYSSPPQAPPEGGTKAVPRPSLHKHPAKRSRSTTARFTFGVGSGSSLTFRCKLDKGPYGRCRSPRVYKRLKTGGHSFHVEAVEPGGRTGKPAVFKWRVL